MFAQGSPRKAAKLVGLLDRSAVVHEGLRALIERESAKRLARLGGTQAAVADDEELRGFVERHALFGEGIAYVDVHLLASVALSDHAGLWTRDKSLLAVAQRMRLTYRLAGH